MEGVDAPEIECENSGSIVAALEQLLPEQETYGVVVEYGVVELAQVIKALIADNWLNNKGDPESEQGRRIKRENLDTLYGNNTDWKNRVWAHSSWLLEKTVGGLRALPD